MTSFILPFFFCVKNTSDLPLSKGFPDSSMVKNLPAMQETLVTSLGWKDPLEKEIATYSSILA